MLATIGKPSLWSGSRKPMKLLLLKLGSAAPELKLTGETVPLPPLAVLKSGFKAYTRSKASAELVFAPKPLSGMT